MAKLNLNYFADFFLSQLLFVDLETTSLQLFYLLFRTDLDYITEHNTGQ